MTSEKSVKTLFVRNCRGITDTTGAESYLLNLMKNFPRGKCESLLVCITNPKLGQTQWLDVLQNSGVPHVLVPVSSTFSLEDFKQTRVIVDDFKPDVIHGIDHRANAVALHAARKANLPMVSSFFGWTNWETTSFRGRIYPIVDRRTMKNASAVIFDSAYSADQMNWSTKRPPAAVIHNGVDLTRFDFESIKPDKSFHQRFFGKENVAIITMIGRVHPVKGQLDFLKAAAKLQKEYAHCRFLIIGDAPAGFENYKAELAAFIEQNELNDVAKITNVDTKEIPALLSSVDMLVAPSYQESFSFALLESMIMAKPIVTTRVGGTPEMITDGEDGLLLAPGNVDELHRGIKRLLDGEVERKRIANNARRKALKNFTVDTMADKTIRLYSQVIDWHHNPPSPALSVEAKQQVIQQILQTD